MSRQEAGRQGLSERRGAKRTETGGFLSLDAFKVHSFQLSAVNEAIAQAPSFRGLECCVVVP